MVNIVGNWPHSDIEQKLMNLLLSEEVDNELNTLSTEKLLELWENLEQKIKVIFTQQVNNFTVGEETSDIENQIKKLKEIKQRIIYNLLNNSENGLLNMFVRNLFPELKLSGASIRKSNINNESVLDITVYPKNGMAIRVEYGQITLRALQKAYNRLDNNHPKRVAEIVNEFSNSILSIQELRETLNCSGLLSGEEILDVIKNKEIRGLLLQYKVQAGRLLEDIERLHDMSCDEEKIKPSEHFSPFDKRNPENN